LKGEMEAATESETESESLTDDIGCADDDDDCTSVSELLATADTLLDDIRAMVSVCVDEEVVRSLPAVRDDEEVGRVADESDVSGLLARIAALESDNVSLLESVDRSLGVGVKFEGLYIASLSRNTELETRLRQYDRQLSTAETRVAKLETELCEKKQVATAAHARADELETELETELKEVEHYRSTTDPRIKELEDDEKRLEGDVELCRGVGLELESLHTAATARIAELEARLCQYGRHLQVAESHVSELETKLHQLNKTSAAAEARITELTVDNERLLDGMNMYRDIGHELSELYDAAKTRIAELEAATIVKAAPTTLKPKNRAGRVTALPPKHPGPPVLASVNGHTHERVTLVRARGIVTYNNVRSC